MKSRVIINADDFGITQGVNKGMIDLIEAGILTSTSVMTNMPFCDEIISYKDKISAGIHLTLTEGKPVLSPKQIPTLINNEGGFFSHADVTKRSVYRSFSHKELYDEFSAQTQKLINIGIKPSHIDTHESFFKYPYFIPVIKELANTHNIQCIRTYSQRRFDYSRLLNPKKIIIPMMLYYQKNNWIKAGLKVTDRIDSLIKFGLDYSTAMNKLKDIFRNLPDGVLELVVHPGYCNDDVTPLGGYVHEREIELKALMSPEFKEILDSSDLELITYNDL